MVAAATSNLCEAANASVQGHASEEKLISSAKQVAASTAQLLVACKVKADQDSEAMRRLQVQHRHTPNKKPQFCLTALTIGVFVHCLLLERLQGIGFNRTMCSFLVHAAFSCSQLISSSQIAGNAVKKASDNLVRAAQKAAFDKADDHNVVVKTKFVGGIAQVRNLEQNSIL